MRTVNKPTLAVRAVVHNYPQWRRLLVLAAIWRSRATFASDIQALDRAVNVNYEGAALFWRVARPVLAHAAQGCERAGQQGAIYMAARMATEGRQWHATGRNV
jgi:hypothetical protein